MNPFKGIELFLGLSKKTAGKQSVLVLLQHGVSKSGILSWGRPNKSFWLVFPGIEM